MACIADNEFGGFDFRNMELDNLDTNLFDAIRYSYIPHQHKDLAEPCRKIAGKYRSLMATTEDWQLSGLTAENSQQIILSVNMLMRHHFAKKTNKPISNR